MYTAIRATSRTLQSVLMATFGTDPDLRPLFDPLLPGPFQISLNNPQEMVRAGIAGLSVWLYRITRDDQRLNAPPERITPFRVRPLPLPVRLHYLMTAVIPVDPNAPEVSPEQEQTIIGKVLQVFHQRPMLRGADLADDFLGTQSEIGVRLETLVLDEMSRVWSAVQQPYQLSTAYEATVAYIAPELQPVPTSPVFAVSPDYGVIVQERQ